MPVRFLSDPPVPANLQLRVMTHHTSRNQIRLLARGRSLSPDISAKHRGMKKTTSCQLFRQ